jgi:hypothetical protein
MLAVSINCTDACPYSLYPDTLRRDRTASPSLAFSVSAMAYYVTISEEDMTGKLMVGAVRILPLCIMLLALPAIITAQSIPPPPPPPPSTPQPTQPDGCADAYFIGVHGVREGPDLNGQGPSDLLKEIWKTFEHIAHDAGKRNVTRHYLRYPNPNQPSWDVVGNLGYILGAKIRGVMELNKFVRETVLKECPKDKNPKIVLVGYSLGAWVINDWLDGNNDLWDYIRAVELYADPLWYRFGPAFPTDPFSN